jgi:N-methylhydantoinase A/oxoprolinase/acetone carboxylase beta subunit
VGAPAATYYHEVARSMKMDLRVPPHAEVANAYGAVMGSIIQRAEVMVTQPQQGEFKLFHGGKPLLFDSLEEARQHGEELVRAQATQQICAAGAHGHEITIAYHDIHVPDSGDGELFLESRIVATAIGPACSWKSDTPSRST